MDFIKLCGVLLLLLGYYMVVTKLWMEIARRIGAFFGFSKWIELLYRKDNG